jgi:hypothetical protein
VGTCWNGAESNRPCGSAACPGDVRDWVAKQVHCSEEWSSRYRPGSHRRGAFLNSRRARIQVSESFEGLSSDVHEVDVLTGVGGGDCGIPFKVGEVDLIDAFIGKDGLVHAAVPHEGLMQSVLRFEY